MMTTEPQSLPKPTLVLIALLQGLALMILHQANDMEFWPYGEPQWLYTFYSVAVIGPLMVLLSLNDHNGKVVLRWIIPFTLLCGLLSFYQGSQALPSPYTRLSTILVWSIPALTLATFKALMYIQQRATGRPFSYSDLFVFSWRNFLTWGLALLFTLAVWGILMLWGGLFKVININFFADLFDEPWFYYPALSIAHGFGIIIFRSQSSIIDTITRIQQALMKFLLVFIAMVSLLFLIALPFTGLTPLWNTGSGSTLILCMQALILFFLNAVYQDNPGQDDPSSLPYPLVIHRFIYVCVALLPIYSAIVLYGLVLRVDQYGLTVERCWGFVIWAFFAAFSGGYLWGIVRKRDAWLQHLSWVNVRLGLCLLAMLLLISSPLLDFRKIAVASQLQRVNSGDITLDELDLYYFRRELAKPGYDALQTIRETHAESHPRVVKNVAALYSENTLSHNEPTQEEFIRSIDHDPMLAIPESLAEAMYNNVRQEDWRYRPHSQYLLFTVDLNSDSLVEYVLVSTMNQSQYLRLFFETPTGWQVQSMQASEYVPGSNVIDRIEKGELEVVEPRWNGLKIGNILYWVRETTEQSKERSKERSIEQ